MDDYIEIAETGCYEWRGSRYLSGYGRIKVDGKSYRVHRFAWIVAHGAIPDGRFVLHRCDNRACVRLDHLFLGTNADNSADMVTKGRSPSGERNGRAKLSDVQVAEIRARYDAGGTNQTALAEKYGVSQALVSLIVRGRYR